MPDQIHSYVDEAGDPTLFGRKRGSGIIVGNDGCSKFFIMGKLEVANPESLSKKLTDIRHELRADPYFAGVPSFDPGRPKRRSDVNRIPKHATRKSPCGILLSSRSRV